MAILFSDKTYRSDKMFAVLQQAIHALRPEIDLRAFPNIGNPDDIEYAIIWYPQEGSLQNLPNLKIIFTTSAGVDGIIHDATLPHGIPIVRNTDPGLAQGMMEYIVMQTLRLHRYHPTLEAQQREGVWKQVPQIKPSARRIGIMGMGEMGRTCALALHGLNFPVSGWSRSPKNYEGITSYAGDESLPIFLNNTDILINVLPLTDATQGILNAELFAQLPKGSSIINAGRGKHLVEQDLLDALDSGHIAAAVLDAFATEPLPQDHPFWKHSQITVTPHIASITDMQTIAHNMLVQIDAFKQGKALRHVVDPVRQY